MLLSRSYHKGFSLVEVLISISIMVIIVTIAIPSFTSFTKSSRVDTAYNELFFMFQYAKSEALKRKETVVVCNSSDGTSCISDGLEWAAEKIIAKIDSGDQAQTVLRVITLNNKDVLIKPTISIIEFLSSGELEKDNKVTVESKGCQVPKMGVISISKMGLITNKAGECSA